MLRRRGFYVDPIKEVKKGILEGTKLHLELTIDGLSMFSSENEWDKYYIPPQDWDGFQIDEDSASLGTKLNLIHKGRFGKWSAARYRILMKLPARDKRYRIYISSRTADNYITSAYYGIRSIAKP